MMVSSKGRYALRVMLDMAEQGDGAWLRLSDIAQRQQLSKKYLESIMAALSPGGVGGKLRGQGGRLPADPSRRGNTRWGRFCGRQRATCARYRVSLRKRRAAEASATAAHALSGRGWRRRSTPMWTITRWHNSCIQGKNQRAAPAARKENKAV